MAGEKWTVMAKGADFNAIAEKFGIDPVVARIIRNRGIVGDEAIDEYLNGGMERLRDPFLLKGMDKAAAILKKKIKEKKLIRVVGDYDIDGVMASYILKRGIAELGGSADIRIPSRVTDGYGMSVNMIEAAREDGIDTIVTCDNGISAHEAVARAKEYGMTVIVTDHHEVLSLPEADAVVDPKREDDTSPNPHLCGAAVAWKLVLAMGGDREAELLQFAAFATVGDIVELTGENRVLVKEGLKRLRKTDNLGLRCLADACSVKMEALGTYHIGFILGPCLNASGRLDTAMRALELLESTSRSQAVRCADELKSLNDTRKSLTEAGVEEAARKVTEGGYEKDCILVLFLPDVHESIAGIIAGRIRERFQRPAFILTRGEECVKGSGRSTEDYSMFEELVKVRDLLLKFGGHPMAAGLSLKEERIGELRRRLNEECPLTLEELAPKVRIDVPMPVNYVSEELIVQLNRLEPFGKGNEKPVFAQKHVFCEHPRLFGVKHNLLRTRIRTMTAPGDADPERLGFQAAVSGQYYDAICFRDVDALAERIRENPELAITYEPQINEYMGQRRIQIVITHFQ